MPSGKTNIIIFGLIATSLAAGQLSQISSQSGQAVTTPNDGKVRVYVYRSTAIVSKEFRPSIFVDEKDVARLQSGRNVILALTPGTHIFRSTDKKDQISVELKAGERYFVRVEVPAAAVKGHGKVTVVLPEQGMGEFEQTKPDDSTMLKDRSMIAPEFVAK